MPTYEYACRACGHEFELFQQMTAKVKRKCPECGRQKLERLIGIGAGVIFKGGGFYETDYRSESYKKAAEAEKKTTEGKSSSDAGSSNGQAGKPSDAGQGSPGKKEKSAEGKSDASSGSAKKARKSETD
ncbi:MAG: zinc ribbon domain-containing protein [Phycisphaerales bacterium]|nr:MAG: zinc ribbon domain-containing protein [Phycisphaerales bacterium]